MARNEKRKWKWVPSFDVVSKRFKVTLGFFVAGVVLFGINASSLDALAIKAATSPRFWCNGPCFVGQALELIGAILGILLMLAGGIGLVECLIPRDQ